MAWSDAAREAALRMRRLRAKGKRPWKEPRVVVPTTPAQHEELNLWAEDHPDSSLGVKLIGKKARPGVFRKRGGRLSIAAFTAPDVYRYLEDDYNPSTGMISGNKKSMAVLLGKIRAKLSVVPKPIGYGQNPYGDLVKAMKKVKKTKVPPVDQMAKFVTFTPEQKAQVVKVIRARTGRGRR